MTVTLFELYQSYQKLQIADRMRKYRNERFLREVVAKLKDKLDAVPGVPYVKAWKDATLRCATYHTHTDTKRCEKWIQDL